jgi:hypothetical protein
MIVFGVIAEWGQALFNDWDFHSPPIGSWLERGAGFFATWTMIRFAKLLLAKLDHHSSLRPRKSVQMEPGKESSLVYSRGGITEDACPFHTHLKHVVRLL